MIEPGHRVLVHRLARCAIALACLVAPFPAHAGAATPLTLPVPSEAREHTLRAQATNEETALPRVLLMDAQALAAARQDARTGAADLIPALAALRRAANSALTTGPFSVMDKKTAPSGGDRHDYVSLSIYWWPNPSTPDGLPYLYRDGQVNPEKDDIDSYDGLTLGRMVYTVETLALAFYLTDESAYADHAASLVRVWFLDEATRMNPNMRFAQITPDRPDAQRGYGIIESRDFTRVIDAVELLAGSPSWTGSDRVALQVWFGQLARWLQESAQGQMESDAPNNHSTWYDAQVAAFALFAGQETLAAQVVAESRAKRIAYQIEPDGSQPRELSRTRPLHYSAFNLQAFFHLATLGSEVGEDLWSYQTEDGRSLRAALDFLLPYAGGAESSPYQDIVPVNYVTELGPVLARAATVWPGGPYEQALTQLATGQPALRLLKLRLGAWTV